MSNKNKNNVDNSNNNNNKNKNENDALSSSPAAAVAVADDGCYSCERQQHRSCCCLKIYRWYNHPDLSWFQLMIGFFMSLLLPLGRIGKIHQKAIVSPSETAAPAAAAAVKEQEEEEERNDDDDDDDDVVYNNNNKRRDDEDTTTTKKNKKLLTDMNLSARKTLDSLCGPEVESMMKDISKQLSRSRSRDNNRNQYWNHNNNESEDTSEEEDDDIIVMIHSKMKIQRRPDILKEWGFFVDTNNTNKNTKEDDDDDEQSDVVSEDRIPRMEDGDIVVHAFYPSSILSSEVKKKVFDEHDDDKIQNQKQKTTGLFIHTKENSVCMDDIYPLNNDDDDSSYPLIVYFHGGGFVMGNPFMGDGFRILHQMIMNHHHSGHHHHHHHTNQDNNNHHHHHSSSDNNNNKYTKFVILSIDYSLAPEYPFPIAAMETLTIASYIMEYNNHHNNHHNNKKISKNNPKEITTKTNSNHKKNSNIHILGISAGGNLATIFGMETIRRYGDPMNASASAAAACLGSVTILCPMLNPSCDTISYYENQYTSMLVSPHWLRWCWSSYLNIMTMKKNTNNNNNNNTTTERVRQQQQRTSSNSSSSTTAGTTSTTTDTNTTTTTTTNKNNDFLLGIDSNRIGWNEECIWKGTNLERLIYPTLHLPSIVSSSSSSTTTTTRCGRTKFIITTNRVDPLHDDGIDLAYRLKQQFINTQQDTPASSSSSSLLPQHQHQQQVIHLDHPGMHWIGTQLNKESFQELVDILEQVLFPTTTTT